MIKLLITASSCIIKTLIKLVKLGRVFRASAGGGLWGKPPPMSGVRFAYEADSYINRIAKLASQDYV